MLVVKNPPADAGRRKKHRFDPWVGKIPEERHINPLQCSCLENPMDRGAWWATIHRVAKSRIGLKRLKAHGHTADLKSVSGISILIFIR